MSPGRENALNTALSGTLILWFIAGFTFVLLGLELPTWSFWVFVAIWLVSSAVLLQRYEKSFESDDQMLREDPALWLETRNRKKSD